MKSTKNNPEFIVYTGSMFSGKTTALLATVERWQFQNKKVIAFKPQIDVRYSESEIVSHLGWKIKAHTIKEGKDIIKILQEDKNAYDVVAVDETFMIPGIADVLIWLFRHGTSVIVSTLDLSSAGKPFKEVEKMLPFCTKIKKCAAVCTICGCDAYYTYRKNESEDEIALGGKELYEPRCFEHHLIINQTHDD